MIGRRLKLARSGAGLSLRALSDRIDREVSAQAIGKYERDQATPRSGVLISLARALNISVDYLAGDSDMSVHSVKFRTKEGIDRQDEDRVKTLILQTLERYLAIEEIIRLPSSDWDKPRSAPYPVHNDISQAELAAISLRQEWGLGIGPIPNLAEIMENRGVKVLFCQLPDRISGLSAQVHRDSALDIQVIALNRSHGGERQRFTIAHEIGRLVLDVAPKLDAERAAYRFAGAFMVPQESVWAEIGKRRSAIGWAELFKLKLLFGVSVQALTYRCLDLGVIGQPVKDELFHAYCELGWRSPPYIEPCAIEGEQSGRFERLCYRALSEGAISESKAAELLEVSTHGLNDLMDKPPETNKGLPTGPKQSAQEVVMR